MTALEVELATMHWLSLERETEQIGTIHQETSWAELPIFSSYSFPARISYVRMDPSTDLRNQQYKKRTLWQ